MKILLKIFIVCLVLFSFLTFSDKAFTDENEKVSIRSGTFIKVMTLYEISTLMADIGDEVCVINLNDMYVYETNAIPQNSKICGVVEDLKEPVYGRDASIKILLNKIITPDKRTIPMKGHLYSSEGSYIGGKTTGSMYYHKGPHYGKGLKPMLQYAPLNVYEIGKHTIIKPGAEIYAIIDEELIIQ